VKAGLKVPINKVFGTVAILLQKIGASAEEIKVLTEGNPALSFYDLRVMSGETEIQMVDRLKDSFPNVTPLIIRRIVNVASKYDLPDELLARGDD